MKTVILHESYFQALANDLTTVIVLTGMFWVNQEYLGSAIPDMVLTCLFFMYVLSKFFGFASKTEVDNKEDALKCIEKIYSKDSEAA